MKTSLLPLLLLGVLLFGGLAVLWLRRKPSDVASQPWPFYLRKPMSVPEQVLYFRLVEAMPEHIVLAQVQLSRFLGVKKGEQFRTWFNRINRLSVDFLVLRKDATVVAAIELDDKSHERSDRREADERKNRALTDAGAKIVRWNVSRLPSREEIREELAVEFAAPKLAADRAGRVEPVLSSPAQ
jgi:hypothetical protein